MQREEIPLLWAEGQGLHTEHLRGLGYIAHRTIFVHFKVEDEEAEKRIREIQCEKDSSHCSDIENGGSRPQAVMQMVPEGKVRS